MTSTRHDELVEEIRLLWCEECSEGPERCDYSPSLDDEACGVGAEKECTERARKVIARVAKGPLPGELSRDVTGDDLLMIIIGASQGTGEEAGDGIHGV